MTKLPLVGMLLLASTLASTSAQAIIIGYTDRTAFLAALPGPAVTEDFESTPAGTTIPTGGPVGAFTFNYDFGPVTLAVTDGDYFITGGYG